MNKKEVEKITENAEIRLRYFNGSINYNAER